MTDLDHLDRPVCRPAVSQLRRLLLASMLLIAALVPSAGCRTCGIEFLLSSDKRALNALKNRTVLPVPSDFDRTVTLEAMLRPGDDRQRWSAQRAAAIEGYVVRVLDANPESANCFSPTRVDAHVELALTPDAPPTHRLVAEVTPPLRDWAKGNGLDWSTATLSRTIVGRRVRVEGWLFFDSEHDDEAENTRPGGKGNWRATAWEVHPITLIAVLH